MRKRRFQRRLRNVGTRGTAAIRLRHSVGGDAIGHFLPAGRVPTRGKAETREEKNH